MSELKTPVKGISRRSFLKTTAAVAGAAAVGGTTMTALAATGEEAAGADEHEVVCVCGCNCQGKNQTGKCKENVGYPHQNRIQFLSVPSTDDPDDRSNHRDPDNQKQSRIDTGLASDDDSG